MLKFSISFSPLSIYSDSTFTFPSRLSGNSISIAQSAPYSQDEIFNSTLFTIDAPPELPSTGSTKYCCRISGSQVRLCEELRKAEETAEKCKE